MIIKIKTDLFFIALIANLMDSAMADPNTQFGQLNEKGKLKLSLIILNIMEQVAKEMHKPKPTLKKNIDKQKYKYIQPSNAHLIKTDGDKKLNTLETTCKNCGKLFEMKHEDYKKLLMHALSKICNLSDILNSIKTFCPFCNSCTKREWRVKK